MAQMITRLKSDASAGETRLYEILKSRLPKDFIVWYEPEVKKLYPDFIIFSPRFGLLVLEVKGWKASQILEARQDFFLIQQASGICERQQSPLTQARGYMFAAVDKLKEYPVLCQPDSNYQGKLCFPYGFGAVISNIKEAKSRDENIYPLLEKPQVAYRDELLEWDHFTDRLLVQRLKDMFSVQFSFPPLTDDQTQTVKGVLYPEGVIRKKTASPSSTPPEVTKPLPPDTSVLVTLDLNQEKLARSLGDGHRLFSGVAGSGKTLILIARAKALANRLSDRRRILILCFNITLASHLRSLLHSDDSNPQYRERIEVRHFHDWAKSLMGRLPNPQEFDDESEYDEFLGDRVLAVLQGRSLDDKWDSVLVDEAHTFSPKWFLCCVAALKDPQDGDLMVVSDGSQSLYKRRKFTWSSVGIKARGRSQKLTQNYRNTQEILTAAWNVVKPLSGDTEDEPTFPAVEPSAALRRGPKPVLNLAKTKVDAVDAVLDRVRVLCESGYAPGEIAILYRWKARTDEALFQGMLKRLHDLGLRAYWITQNGYTKQNYSVRTPGVRVLTGLSALGLEFKAVLILWAEQYADCCNADPEVAAIARKQLYVAMTRAQDELHLFGGKYARIFGELESERGFEVERVRSTHTRV